MSPERWRLVREIFDSALEQPPAEVEGYLREACGSDAEMYSDVKGMLQAHQRSGILDHTPFGAAPPPAGIVPVFVAGQVVSGRYRIVRYLSRGGMGEVYEAQDLELPEPVALKTLLPSIASDEAMIGRFKKEISLSRKVAHPNVCKVYDLESHQEAGSRPVIYLSMEFLPGETLAAKLERDGRLSPAEALPILRQVAEALEAAHQAGVIHRDLKPSNIMLVPAAEGVRAVVTDFGLARSFVNTGTTVTMSNTLVGTLDYMAPELLTGTVATFSSDVYALGMVAYKMITGVLPFGSDTPLAAAILRSKQPVPSPRTVVPTLDEHWERTILRAVDRDPQRRFTRAHHFIQELQGEAASMTVRLPVMTRRRAVVLGVAVVALTGAAAGLWQWQSKRGLPPPEATALYRKGVEDISAGAYFAATKALGRATTVAPRFTMAHTRLAEAWVNLDLPERANQEMLLAMRQERSNLTRLDHLEIEATYAMVTRDFATATAKREQIVSLAGSDADGAALYVDLGQAYERSSRPDKALAAYRHAAAGPSHQPAAWLRIGILAARSWRNPQSLAQSEEAFRQAEEMYQESSNLEGLTEVDFQRGVAANRRGQLEQGAAYLRKALDTAHLAGNLQKEVSARLQLATNAYQSGDATRAQQIAQEALEIAHANQMESLAIGGLVNLGNSYRGNRKFSDAEKYLTEALGMARRTGSNRLAALCLYSLAALHNETKQPEESSREAAEALAFFQPNHWEAETFSCLTLLGRAKRDLGDYKSAEGSFARLLDIAEKAQDHSQMALAHESLGQVLDRQEMLPQALIHFRKSLELYGEPRLLGYAALQCATLLWELGRYDEARLMFEKSEGYAARFVSLKMNIQASRVQMALSQLHYAAAASSLLRLLTGGEGQNSSQGALQAGLCLAMLGRGNGASGLRYCQDAVETAQKNRDVADLFSARVSLLQGLARTKDKVRAVTLFHELEPSLDGHPLSRWLVLGSMAAMDGQFNSRARDALKDLERVWGSGDFQSYLARPDVKSLARPLLQGSPAQ
jgi:tetratricopeptide (TPR) repeat protein